MLLPWRWRRRCQQTCAQWDRRMLFCGCSQIKRQMCYSHLFIMSKHLWGHGHKKGSFIKLAVANVFYAAVALSSDGPTAHCNSKLSIFRNINLCETSLLSILKVICNPSLNYSIGHQRATLSLFLLHIFQNNLPTLCEWSHKKITSQKISVPQSCLQL